MFYLGVREVVVVGELVGVNGEIFKVFVILFFLMLEEILVNFVNGKSCV